MMIRKSLWKKELCAMMAAIMTVSQGLPVLAAGTDPDEIDMESFSEELLEEDYIEEDLEENFPNDSAGEEEDHVSGVDTFIDGVDLTDELWVDGLIEEITDEEKDGVFSDDTSLVDSNPDQSISNDMVFDDGLTAGTEETMVRATGEKIEPVESGSPKVTGWSTDSEDAWVATLGSKVEMLEAPEDVQAPAGMEFGCTEDGGKNPDVPKQDEEDDRKAEDTENGETDTTVAAAEKAENGDGADMREDLNEISSESPTVPSQDLMEEDEELDQKSDPDAPIGELEEDVPEEWTEAEEAISEQEIEAEMFEEAASEERDNLADGENKCGENLFWSVSGTTLTIYGTGTMYDFDNRNTPGWASCRSQIETVIIEPGVTSIGQRAFEKFYKLTSVSIPETVDTLGSMAFVQSSKLQRISLPEAVREIPYALFGDCTSLKKVHMPGATSIGDYAFQSTKVDVMEIGPELTQISDLAFFKTCFSSYDVNPANPKYSDIDGVLFEDGGKTLKAYPPAKVGTSYTVPAGVTKVGKAAFAYNANLTSLYFSGTVQELGESACQGMSALLEITIPDSVTSVGYFTFYECSALGKVVFGNGLTKTSYEMFENCTALKEIDFGGLRELDARTFAYCNALKTVVLPSTITKIGNGSFGECRHLESFTALGLTLIPYQTFCNDKTLCDVTLAEGLKEICREAFAGCSGLKAIELPESVTYVDTDAFPSTTVITCKNPNMTRYGTNGYRVTKKVTVEADRLYDSAFGVLSLVNAERAKVGLAPLSMDASLMETAMVRAAETGVLFSHTRPDGSSCMSANEKMVAENIAAGSSTPDAVMDGWMNSQGHRENILTGSYTTIGIGCVQIDGTRFWVQCFGMDQADGNCEQPANTHTVCEVAMATESFNEAPTTHGIIWGSSTTYQYKMKVSAPSYLYVGEEGSVGASLINPGFVNTIPLDTSDICLTVSDPSVAIIENGKLKALAAGTVTVTASTSEGYYTGNKSVSIFAKPTPPVSQTSANQTSTNQTSGNRTPTGQTASYVPNNQTIGSQSTGNVILSSTDDEDNEDAEADTVEWVYTNGEWKQVNKAGKKVGKAAVPKTPKGISLKARKGRKAVLKWQKVTGADGYIIRYASKKSMKNATSMIKGSKAASATIKGMKKGKRIYVQVCAFKNVNGERICSGWSKVKSVKGRK